MLTVILTGDSMFYCGYVYETTNNYVINMESSRVASCSYYISVCVFNANRLYFGLVTGLAVFQKNEASILLYCTDI